MPKSFLKAVAIFVFAVMALYALVLVPLYEIIACDIMLMDTLLFDAIDLFMQWTEIFALSLILAVLLIGVYQTGDAKKCRALFTLLGGALVFKYVGAVLSLSVVHGAFDITLDYGAYLVSLALELLPCALLVFLTHKYVTSRKAKEKEMARAAAILGESVAPTASLLPFAKMFDRSNPLQKIAYICLGVLTAIRALAYIAAELAYTMLGFTYHISDLPITLLYLFLLVLLPSFIGYLILFATVRFAKKKFFDNAEA